MRITSRSMTFGLASAFCLATSATAIASPLPSRALASLSDAAPVKSGERWSHDYEEDDDYDDDYYPPEYYLPPPPPPIVRAVPAPPAMMYESPVYGWLTPPRPSNCGKYRYWNGEYCADARYEPPYTGPRW